MLTRTIGKFLRGKQTPLQVVLATTLGAMIGFVPGFWQGPGLTIVLLLLLLILNANLLVAGVAGLLAKVVSIPLLPVSFAIGRILLDGPTQPIFKWAVNAPVFALFGFEHYATTGALVTGFAVGLLLGLLLVLALNAFRRRMSRLETDSERYQRVAANPLSRLAVFIFVGGGHGKATYEQLLQRRLGNPIRILGVVVALLIVGLLFVVRAFATEPILTAAMQRGLERANGATVDLDSASLDAGAGRLTLAGLALADPNDLDTNVFSANRVQADISLGDLLRKRIALDQVVVSEAATGARRAVRGVIVGPPPRPASDPPPPEPGEKTLEDYMEQAKAWKERLAQLRRWLETVSTPSDEAGQREDLPPDVVEKRRQERIRRQIRAVGYARVRAEHLVVGAPTFVVYDLQAEGVRAAQMDDDLLDIRGRNLSTQPWLLEQPASVEIRSRSGRLAADVDLGGGGAQAVWPPQVDFALTDIPGNDVAALLAIGDEPPIAGGAVDVRVRGGVAPSEVDLDMRATVRNSMIVVPGAGSQEVEELTLPIGLRGPLDTPRIVISEGALAQALADAGAARLAKEVRGRAEEALGEAAGDLGGEAGEAIRDVAGSALEGVFGGKKDEKKKKKKGDGKKKDDPGDGSNGGL